MIKYADASPDTFLTSGIYRVSTVGSSGNGYNFPYGQVLVLRGTTSSDTIAQIAVPYFGSNLYFRSGTVSNFTDANHPWWTIFSSGNCNLPTVPWTCSSLTASGKITAYNQLQFTYGGHCYISAGSEKENGALIFKTRNSHRLIITEDGKVGIGTDSPTEKLHVTGNILLTGSMRRDSDTISPLLIHNYSSSYDGGWARSVLECRVDDKNAFSIMSFGNYTQGATNNKIQYVSLGFAGYDGLNLRISDTDIKWGTNPILHSSNFNSYAPKLDGTGATGTWGISISGNAATATNADKLDGYHKDDILRKTYNPTSTISLNDVVANGIDFTAWDYSRSSNINNQPGGDGASSAASVVSFGTGYPFQIYSDYNNTSLLYYRSFYSNTGWKAWRQFAFIDSNVASSSKWATPRTITLTGSVTGSVSIDGSQNVSLATTTNHTHSYAGSSAAGGDATRALAVADYGDTRRTIQIGYAGTSLNTSNLTHIAGYTNGGTQIKDVPKSVLQSWLGLGSAAYTNSDAYAAASHTHSYLPLTGGTITGYLTLKHSSSGVTSPLTIDTNSTVEVGQYFRMSGTNKGWIGYHPNYGMCLYTYNGQHRLGIKDDGIGYIDTNTILHSGNYNSYAPKLDGTGATGTWGISITGNAGNADTVDNKHASDFATTGHTHDGRYQVISSATASGITHLATDSFSSIHISTGSGGTMSFSRAPASGKECHIVIYNSGSSNITITLPSSYRRNVSSITIASGAFGEVNVLNAAGTIYVRAV